MAVLQTRQYCKKCGKESSDLWPLGGGVCGCCLVNNFTLEQALNVTCSCRRNEIIAMFKGKKCH